MFTSFLGLVLKSWNVEMRHMFKMTFKRKIPNFPQKFLEADDYIGHC